MADVCNGQWLKMWITKGRKENCSILAIEDVNEIQN
ncbi:hypothetical protein BJG92_02298 [Arthrobacter sp. SO5]|nr:hypothetical protein [Arthrobacter sp. SO5]